MCFYEKSSRHIQNAVEQNAVWSELTKIFKEIPNAIEASVRLWPTNSEVPFNVRTLQVHSREIRNIEKSVLHSIANRPTIFCVYISHQ